MTGIIILSVLVFICLLSFLYKKKQKSNSNVGRNKKIHKILIGVIIPGQEMSVFDIYKYAKPNFKKEGVQCSLDELKFLLNEMCNQGYLSCRVDKENISGHGIEVKKFCLHV